MFQGTTARCPSASLTSSPSTKTTLQTDTARSIHCIAILPTLPPHAADPSNKSPNILPLTQLLNTIPILSQLLITLHAMHETMASPAQPRDLVELPFLSPSTTESLYMHRTRYQVVICQRDPRTGAKFASGSAGCGIIWWW